MIGYILKKIKKFLENKKIYKSLSKQSFLTWEKNLIKKIIKDK